MGRAFRVLGYSAGLAAAAGAAVYQTDVLSNQWCSALRVVRFGRAALAAILVTADYKWSLRRVQYGTVDYQDTLIKVHERSALRLREMCRLNGGLFIKVGQHVGSLQYLLPLQYVDTFKVFHSEAPETPLPRLKLVIEEELGRPVEEVFSELSARPLGAASLAQCHRGVLVSDGRTVAVKIQHPDVGRNAYTDMDTMDFLVWCVKHVFPEFRLQWLVDEVRTNLPRELDFTHEAHNQERFAAMFSHLSFVKAPQVYWELTTPRLLTMEFCEGAKVNNLEYIKANNISVDDVCLKLGRMYSEMIFLRGFIHCDPHPGNVYVRRLKGGGGGAEIVLLDHGLYKELSESFRLNYCRLWQALIHRDVAEVRRCCEELNAGELSPLLACMITARNWHSIQTGITSLKRNKNELTEIQRSIPLYLPEITQLLDNVPRQLVLILKTNDLLRGIEHSLRASVHRQSYLTMSRYCVEALGEHEATQASGWAHRACLRARTYCSVTLLRLYGLWLWWTGAWGAREHV